MRNSRRRSLALVLAAALLAAACGGDSDDDGAAASAASAATTPETTVAPATTAAPTTEAPGPLPITVIDARGVEVVIESTERILPLDGDVAEVVFALGLGDQVVATDISATFPPEADALPEIGYQRALSAEPIIEFAPTVVLGTDLAGPPETIESLEAVGIPVVIVPSETTPDGPAIKIEAVANALGVPEVGARLAGEVNTAIDAATVGPATGPDAPRVVALYIRGTNVQLVLGEESGIGWLLDAAGAVDIADELGVIDAEPISAEAIVLAAPDVIVVPELGLESVGGVEGLMEIPGLAETPAGENGAVLSYDDQLMLGNGPRTGEFLAELVDDLNAATSGATE